MAKELERSWICNMMWWSWEKWKRRFDCGWALCLSLCLSCGQIAVWHWSLWNWGVTWSDFTLDRSFSTGGRTRLEAECKCRYHSGVFINNSFDCVFGLGGWAVPCAVGERRKVWCIWYILVYTHPKKALHTDANMHSLPLNVNLPLFKM